MLAKLWQVVLAFWEFLKKAYFTMVGPVPSVGLNIIGSLAYFAGMCLAISAVAAIIVGPKAYKYTAFSFLAVVVLSAIS